MTQDRLLLVYLPRSVVLRLAAYHGEAALDSDGGADDADHAIIAEACSEALGQAEGSPAEDAALRSAWASPGPEA